MQQWISEWDNLLFTISPFKKYFHVETIEPQSSLGESTFFCSIFSVGYSYPNSFNTLFRWTAVDHF